MVRALQVCRCAGQPSSDLVDACMHNRNPSRGGRSGMSFGNTLFLLMVVVGVMSAAGYVHYRRTQAHMRDQVGVVVMIRERCGLPLDDS